MGDGSAAGQLHGMAQRHGVDNLGFASLWRGTPQIGCARVVDSGYPYEDRVGQARARANGNPTVQEQCERVRYHTLNNLL